MSGNTEPKRPAEGKPRGSRFAGLVGLVEVLRSLPDRLKRPEALLTMMAIFASIGVHMPPYVGLGALADYFSSHPPPTHTLPPSEVSFEVPPEHEAPHEQPAPPPEPPKQRHKREKKQPKLAEAKPEPTPTPVVPEPPKPKAPELLPKKAVSEVTVQPPPPKAEPRKQSVTQKSEDPDVAPPPNAQFLAEQNRRVEEETVARVTDTTRDDPNPVPSAPQAPGEEVSGDSDADQRAARDSKPTPDKSADKPQTASAEPTPPTQQPSQRPVEARKAEAAAPAQPIIIHDPMGSFALVPAQPARAAQSARSGSAGTAGAQPNLKVSWRAFEETFGAEQLAQDRMPREAKRRGAGREKRWSEFRASIENYVAGVKPGNTTALNAAADPFAAYLAAFHRNLHIEFAHEFLGGLPMTGELADPNLVTKVEIVVNPDGTLDRVGVVGSSGNMIYDFGAFNAVQRGAPYPPTPEKIRSPDGRVYVRWALHRNESQCGTWNAEPFMLRTAPRSPNDPPEDNVSPYRSAPGDQHGGAPKQPTTPVKAVVPGETLGLRTRRTRVVQRI